MAALPELAWEIPELKQVLLGCYDEASPLALLRGHSDVLSAICTNVVDMWKHHLSDTTSRGVMSCVGKVGAPAPCVMPTRRKLVQFPPPWPMDSPSIPSSFHVNMMPFVMGDESTLPPSCVRYHDMIMQCLRVNRSEEIGKIGYLTIHESGVEAGTNQRRPGLHVEAAAVPILTSSAYTTYTADPVWGGGLFAEHSIYGGLYMASTTANSCGVFDMTIRDHHRVARGLGDVEHLRPLLHAFGHNYVLLRANELVWMTDRTPHESLPLPATTYRQYFRLVTSGVSHWYADHSTPNPLGVQPAAIIVHGDKLHDVQDLYDDMAPIHAWPTRTTAERVDDDSPQADSPAM